MFIRQRPSICLLFVLFMCALASAQERAPATRSNDSPPITVATAGASVRFTALGAVERMRLEVFDPSSTPVFDTGFRPGNVRDWRLTGAHGERLTEGTYLCVVTIREVSGRLSFKQGSVLVENGLASLALSGSGQPERVEAEQALSARSPVEPTAMTLVAHDGADGQVTSTSGALTFRTGDVLAGADREQMRVTPDGRVGIGTKKPQAVLDVAGAIRTTEGISFADGTVLTSATGRGQKLAPGEDPSPLISGSGTTGRIPKWTDGPTGALGDSIVFETAARIGVGTTAPTAKLDVAGTVNTSTQYNIAGLRVLSVPATNNTFAGVSAGPSNTGSDNSFYGKEAGLMNTGGLSNSFFGSGAGRQNQTGGNNAFFGFQAGRQNTASGNSFFGSQAGTLNTTGDKNSFFGIQAGGFNNIGHNNSYFGNQAGASGTSANSNSFFGSQAGLANTTGNQDSFFGTRAGAANKSGTFNSFFGFEVGLNNTTGPRNSFFGNHAGSGNTTGGSNSFFGILAGSSNQTGSYNTVVGSNADVGSNNLSNATAIGHRAYVTQSNSLVLGSIDNINFASADTRVGIGVTAPSAKLHVAGASNVATTPLMILQSSGSQIPLAFKSGATEAARIRANDGGSLVFATLNGTEKNIHFRAGDDSATDLFIQSSTGRVGIGTTSPDATLDVFGTIRFDAYGSGNGAELCRVYATRLIANCSSSSIRYKENVLDFRSGLDVVRRLRPVSFNWKNDGQRDIGLVAEEVNKVEPLLSTYEAEGEVDGVRYNRLPVVLINAVQEQQAQLTEQQRLIAQQQQQLRQQQSQIEELKRAVCLTSPGAEICRTGRAGFKTAAGFRPRKAGALRAGAR